MKNRWPRLAALYDAICRDATRLKEWALRGPDPLAEWLEKPRFLIVESLDGGGYEARVQFDRVVAVIASVVGAVWLAATVGVVAAAVRRGEWMLLLLAGPHGFTGSQIAHRAATGLVNQVHVRMGAGRLRLESKPLPHGRHIDCALHEVSCFFARAERSGRTSRWCLFVERTDGTSRRFDAPVYDDRWVGAAVEAFNQALAAVRIASRATPYRE